jgi:23S rRNA (guanosine2251-2'-O)-methyltransferase
MKGPHNEKVYIYGRHALMEALRAKPEVIKKVFIERDNRDKEMRDLVTKLKIPTAELATGKGKEMAGRDAVHQGVIAVMAPDKLLISFDAFLNQFPAGPLPSTAVAVLGEVQDPHNVGAVIRSAAAFGLSAVLIPEHNQAQITGSVIKSSAGLAFTIPLVSIGNVNHALKVLKLKGFWTYALAMDGKVKLGDEPFDTPTAFVIGNEGHGVRAMTRAACDIELAIPMHERAESLNAAASAGIVFYEWSKRHPEAL